MRQAVVQLTRKLTRQRPAQSHQQGADVTKGHVAAETASGLSRFDHAQHRFDGFLACLADLRVVERDSAQQRWHDGGNAQIERAMHVAGERSKRIWLIRQRGARLMRGSTENVERQAAHQ